MMKKDTVYCPICDSSIELTKNAEYTCGKCNTEFNSIAIDISKMRFYLLVIFALNICSAILGFFVFLSKI